ncbi:hypothetical protein [Nannocystis sp.]|uniref:hypothetical protein n=1 Tax=Nannocystis sp. TaxID=1962667 RepID=UPI0025E3AD45|nr:hypothetical protein [Nannocystis sp.]MBK7826517.1 hypothetical protein [Nannocystis sp.]
MFTALLAGCAKDTPGSDEEQTYGCNGGCSCDHASADVLLSAADYALWQQGEGPPTTSGDGGSTSTTTATSGIDSSTSPMTDTTTGDAASSSSTDTTTGDGGSSSTTVTTGTDATTFGVEPTGGDLNDELCAALCQHYTAADTWGLYCTLADDAPPDEVHVVCTWTTGCDGRRHACLRSSGEGMGADPLTAWLARAAHDEAGSVHAFDALHSELTDHGAPASLLRRVRRAAADERRHTIAVDRLVRARRGAWRRPRVHPMPTRGLRALAIENAVEGCVRETWAALSAAHQAAHARNPAIRTAMLTIAADERRHAELAWAIDAWVLARLGAADRRAVEFARSAAACSLRRGLAARRLPPAVFIDAGVPHGASALRLVAGLAAALWRSHPPPG